MPVKEDWTPEEWRMGMCAAATAASGSNVGRSGVDGGVRVVGEETGPAFVTTSVNHSLVSRIR